MTTAELQIVLRAQDRAAAPIRKLKGQLTDLNKSVAKSGSAFKGLGAIVGGMGVASVAGAALRAGANYAILKENAELAFTTMLGSGDKARAMIQQIADTAKKTPFGFEDLTRASQRMLAFGFKAEEVIPILTSVGDAVSAMGGSADMIDRVSVALGQMRAKGKVSAEEMMQLTEAGIPAWQILAENVESISPALAAAQKAGKLTQEQVVQRLMKMSEQGKLKAPAAIEALRKGMASRFGGLSEKQLKTTSGATSALSDSLKELFGALEEGPLKTVTGYMITLAEEVPKITAAFKGLPDPVKEVIGWFGTAALAVAKLGGELLGPLGLILALGGGQGLAGVVGTVGRILGGFVGAGGPLALLGAAFGIAKLGWDRDLKPVFAALETYLTTFPHVKVAISWANDQAKKIADWLLDLGSSIATTVKVAVQWANDAARDLATWANAAARSVTQTVKVAVEWASQAAYDLATWVAGRVVAVVQTVKVAWEWANQWSYETATWVVARIGEFAQTVRVAWEWASQWAMDTANWVAGKIGEFGQTVKTAWEWASNYAHDLAEWVSLRLGEHVQTVKTAWEWLSAGAYALASWVGAHIGTFTSLIKIDFQWLTEAARKIYEWWTGTGGTVVGGGGRVVVIGGGAPPAMAAGGIVSRPTLAMIGEAGPEAVVPLGRGGGLGHTTIVNLNAPVYGFANFEDAVVQAVDRANRRGR